MFRVDRPGWLLERCSNAPPRGMAAHAVRVRKETTRKTEPGLQAPWHFFGLRKVKGGKAAMRTRLSICAKKARYPSQQDAHLAAARADLPLRPYRCDRCRQFHLTSRTKGKWLPRPLD